MQAEIVQHLTLELLGTLDSTVTLNVTRTFRNLTGGLEQALITDKALIRLSVEAYCRLLRSGLSLLGGFCSTSEWHS